MKMALGFFVIAAVVVITATFPFADDAPHCYSYVAPTCPTAFKCSDTFCDVPSEAAINQSNAYSLDDIGLPFGDNTVGVLQLRSQDVGCKSSARWDESHSLAPDACVLDGGGSGSYLLAKGDKHTVECYVRYTCGQTCEANAGEYYPTEFTMTKGDLPPKKYLLPLYRCNASNNTEVSRIQSAEYVWCDNETVCPPPVNSGSGGGN